MDWAPARDWPLAGGTSPTRRGQDRCEPCPVILGRDSALPGLQWVEWCPPPHPSSVHLLSRGIHERDLV